MGVGSEANDSSSTVLDRYLFEREGEAPAELSQEFGSAGASLCR